MKKIDDWIFQFSTNQIGNYSIIWRRIKCTGKHEGNKYKKYPILERIYIKEHHKQKIKKKKLHVSTNTDWI